MRLGQRPGAGGGAPDAGSDRQERDGNGELDGVSPDHAEEEEDQSEGGEGNGDPFQAVLPGVPCELSGGWGLARSPVSAVVGEEGGGAEARDR